MKGKMIAVIAIGIVLIGVLGLCGLTLFGSFAWFQENKAGVRLFYNEDTSFQVTETQTYPAGAGVKLTIDNALGDITVTTHDSDEFVVEMVKTGWGEDDESAKKAAESIQVDVERTAKEVKLTYHGDEGPDVILEGNNRSNSVSLNIKIPVDTPVDLRNTFGQISLEGSQAGASILSTFSTVKVQDVAGPLSIANNQGNLEVRNVKGGEGDLSLETTFGSITLDQVSGGNIHIQTSNGVITVTGLEASGAIAIENQFGKIDLRDFRGASLKISNQNGETYQGNGELSGDLEVKTTFGDVKILSVSAAAYMVETQNGAVSLDGAQGRINVTNQFGDITITNSSEAILNLNDSNGKISYSGSLDADSSHSLGTSFNDIVLSLPSDSAFDLVLEAQFGEIKSELPVTLSGALQPDVWEGELNGGGPELHASTQNGSIYIVNLEP
jgi:DUF4097 and DUF4098 domain-containing protein YvlB